MESSIAQVEDNHYQIRLPWKKDEVRLPHNRSMALTRLNYLKNRFLKDRSLFERYRESIKANIDKGYASPVEQKHSMESSRIWYLPHHPVVNPKKPEKLRVVFDCAAKFGGVSLNTELLSGPDLTNNLVAVLMRFRQEQVAITSDIEGMFNQVRVYPEDRSALRFLWWKNHDFANSEVIEYHMNVHIFGVTSSPAGANYALRQTALDHVGKYPQSIIESVAKNFYVDDFLKSLPSVNEALQYVDQMPKLLQHGGFHLTKWMSNKREVLCTVPVEERGSSILNLDLDSTLLPHQRTLGVQWDMETDSLKFDGKFEVLPYTRRGILSIVSSLYDPLGLVSPVILEAKLLLQDLCRDGFGWDDDISVEKQQRWSSWLTSLQDLQGLSIPRCMKSGYIKTYQLHVFCDASDVAYGCVAYLRMIDEFDTVQISLVFGKSRLAPIKVQTIPRLELQAAVIGARIGQMVVNELEYNIEKVLFWTDSTAVLHFLKSKTKRFKIYVSNRVSEILDLTELHQWHYVPSLKNAGDHASRAKSVKDLINSSWFSGPEFLLQREDTWNFGQVKVTEDDISDEYKSSNVGCVSKIEVQENTGMDKLITYTNSWYKMKRCSVWMVRFKKYL